MPGSGPGLLRRLARHQLSPLQHARGSALTLTAERPAGRGQAFAWRARGRLRRLWSNTDRGDSKLVRRMLEGRDGGGHHRPVGPRVIDRPGYAGGLPQQKTSNARSADPPATCQPPSAGLPIPGRRPRLPSAGLQGKKRQLVVRGPAAAPPAGPIRAARRGAMALAVSSVHHAHRCRARKAVSVITLRGRPTATYSAPTRQGSEDEVTGGRRGVH